jgi:predicted permease
VRDAQAEVDGLLRRLKATHGAEMSAEGALVAGLHAELARGARTSLLALLGAVGCVLLVACVNLAGATLARNETRQREFAVRAALGAGRGRLVRQLLAENLVLAGAGGALGIALAFGLTRVLAALAPAALPAYATLRVDARVLAFAAGVTLLTGLAVGLAPAWQATRRVERSVARTGRGAVDGGLLPGRRALIAAEVALALMLLAGAGLLVRSLDALLNEELGFRPARVLAANVALPGALYDDTARVSGFFARLGPELRALPGVESVGLINAVPFGGEGGNSGFMVDGGAESVGDADYRVVDAGYFPTVGIPLVAGRAFADADGPGAPHALLINQTAARRYWPGTNPLGHRVRFPGMDSHADQWLTIVGVVGDARDDGLDAPPRPAMYVHVLQRPERLRQASTMVLRAGTPPELLTAAVRARVRALDPNVPVQLAPLQTFVARSVAGRRFAAGLLSGSRCSPSGWRRWGSTACSPSRWRSVSARSACAWHSAPAAATYGAWSCATGCAPWCRASSSARGCARPEPPAAGHAVRRRPLRSADLPVGRRRADRGRAAGQLAARTPRHARRPHDRHPRGVT